MAPVDRELLSPDQVQDGELKDWRQLNKQLRARFRTNSFAAGLAFVNQVGAAAEVMDHHPDIVLTYSEVVVTLFSHDVGGITSRDLRLAREISSLADKLGIASDVRGVTLVEIGLDTQLGAQLAPFYAALLRSEIRNGEPTDPSGQTPTLWWQDTGEVDEELALPPQTFEQRWHFDVWVPADDAEDRLRGVIQAGGRLVSDAGAPNYWVVEDAEGNRSCICTALGR
ncbi:4a-hydroxytetrahydrobiopterin dehydratase [Ferrimicrobium sp.]|uniref:4a-hydroxytetrahydrobiopterin dehydratase n=1 Tax=Ferrimicrobium sp. TaxID=2926050 RepID=UPI00260EC9E0|nr:4a-hydroxytetrahydrobiopterin dehydratase [Ferrimicrobium sp.]